MDLHYFYCRYKPFLPQTDNNLCLRHYGFCFDALDRSLYNTIVKAVLKKSNELTRIVSRCIVYEIIL